MSCLVLAGTAHAGTLGEALVTRSVERADSVGAVTAISFDGRSSAGIVGRVGITERLALAAMVRARTDDPGEVGDRRDVVAGLDAIWQVTRGRLSATYGDRAVYPIRLELIGGLAFVDLRPAASLGIALRVRISTRLAVDVALRDELTRGVVHTLDHVPELVLAVSWAAPTPREDP